jgi:hypothetical protein
VFRARRKGRRVLDQLRPGGLAMKMVVDLTACEGYGQCAFLAPEAFRINGESAGFR